MIDPKGWTADRVREQLQNAVYLEMWTVPVYLTAAYSIDVPIDPSTGRPELFDLQNLPTKSDGSFDFDKFTDDQCNQFAFDSILSVAIQEMLHVELAANLLNAVRPELNITAPYVKFTGEKWAPAFNPPSLPYCLSTPPPGIELTLGPVNENQALLFQWIEARRQAAPDPYAYSPQYDSIGNFYTALGYGVMACWADLYPYPDDHPPTADQLLQRDDWGAMAAKAAARGGLPQLLARQVRQSSARLTAGSAGATPAGGYPFSIKIYGVSKDALAAAEAAMLAIKSQGEGAGHGDTVPPQFRPTTGEPIEILLDEYSHYDRFTQILQLVQAGRIRLRPSTQAPATLGEQLQTANSASYSSFLYTLENTTFSTDPSNPNNALPADAMQGIGNRTVQLWQYDLTPEYAWIDPSSYIDRDHTRGLHACQGLDAAGTSDCATAFFHTCGGANMCKGQGGCGYSPYTPNANACTSQGGCGAPIPNLQVFDSQSPNAGQSVWELARKQMGFSTDLPPNDFRTLLTPTSTDKAKSSGTPPPSRRSE